jgi:hypothetical protein
MFFFCAAKLDLATNGGKEAHPVFVRAREWCSRWGERVRHPKKQKPEAGLKPGATETE